VCVNGSVCGCVCERERVSVCASLRVRECVWVCVSVWVRESVNGWVIMYVCRWLCGWVVGWIYLCVVGGWLGECICVFQWGGLLVGCVYLC